MSRMAKTGRITEIPVVLLVGCSLGLISRAWESAARAGTIVRSVDPSGVAAGIASFRPLAILMTEATFATIGDQIAPLVKIPAATVVCLSSEDVSDEELDGRIRAAVVESEKLRRGITV